MSIKNKSIEDMNIYFNVVFTQTIDQLSSDIYYNRLNCNAGDAERAMYTSGSASGLAQALTIMGHKTEVFTWIDGGCSRISRVTIDNLTIFDNGEFNHKAIDNICIAACS